MSRVIITDGGSAQVVADLEHILAPVSYADFQQYLDQYIHVDVMHEDEMWMYDFKVVGTTLMINDDGIVEIITIGGLVVDIAD